MALSCIVSEIKLDIGRKSRFFHTPLHLTSPLWGFASEYRHTVWRWKTRMVRLADGEKKFEVCLAVSTEYRRVPDGRTDGRIDRHLATA